MEETLRLSSSEWTSTVAGMSPDFVGFRELPKVLGVSRATAARYANRPGFPKPVEELASGRVWRRKEVERWAKKNPPRPPGRPPKKP